MMEAAVGPDDPDVAVAVTNLGIAASDLGDHDAGVALLERSLAIRHRALGPDHTATAGSELHLGRALVRRGDPARAAELCGHARRVLQQADAPTHPRVATRKELLMHYRSVGYERRLFEGGHVSAAELGGALSDVMAENEEQRVLLRALRALPLDLQIVIELFYWEAMQIAEVASVVEIPPGTVKTRLHGARAQFRDRIAELAKDGGLHRTTVDSLESWAHGLRRALGRAAAS